MQNARGAFYSGMIPGQAQTLIFTQSYDGVWNSHEFSKQGQGACQNKGIDRVFGGSRQSGRGGSRSKKRGKRNVDFSASQSRSDELCRIARGDRASVILQVHLKCNSAQGRTKQANRFDGVEAQMWRWLHGESLRKSEVRQAPALSTRGAYFCFRYAIGRGR